MMWLILCLVMSILVWNLGFHMIKQGSQEMPEGIGLKYVTGFILTSIGCVMFYIFLGSIFYVWWRYFTG